MTRRTAASEGRLVARVSSLDVHGSLSGSTVYTVDEKSSLRTVTSSRSSLISLTYTLLGDQSGDYLVARRLSALSLRAKDRTENIASEWPVVHGDTKAGKERGAGLFWMMYSEVDRIRRSLKTDAWRGRAVQIQINLLSKKEAQACELDERMGNLCRIYEAIQRLESSLSDLDSLESSKSVADFRKRIFETILCNISSTGPLPPMDALIRDHPNVIEHLCEDLASGDCSHGAQRALARCVTTARGKEELACLDKESPIVFAALENLLELNSHFARKLAFEIFGPFANASALAGHPTRRRYYDLLVGPLCLGALAQPWQNPSYHPAKPGSWAGGAQGRMYREAEVACTALDAACAADFFEEVCASDVPRLLVSELERLVARDEGVAAVVNDEERDDFDTEREMLALLPLIGLLLTRKEGRRALEAWDIRTVLPQFVAHPNRAWIEFSLAIVLTLSMKMLQVDDSK